MNPIDFSKYKVKNPQQPIEKQGQQQVSQPFDVEKYRVREPSKLQETGRHLARTGARATETVLGLPGDIAQLGKGLASVLPEEPAFLKKDENIVQKKGRELIEKLPTSQDLQEFSSQLTSGFTDPQGAWEKFGDEITGLSTALLIPMKDPTKFKSLLKSLGLSFGKATIAKGLGKGAELLGAEEKGKLATELGSLLLMGAIGPNVANEYVEGAYNQARKAIPNGTMLPTQNLNEGLQQLEGSLSSGIMTATKKQVLKDLKSLKNKASGGAMPASELVEAYHDINETMTSQKLFDELSKTQMRKLKNRYNQLKGEIDNELSSYGKYNPEFYENWKSANQGFATIQESKKLNQWISRKVKNLPEKLAGGVALELFYGHPIGAAATTAGIGTAYMASRAGQALYQISKSPLLRKHYLNAAKAGANQNFPAFLKSIEKLEKGLNQSSESQTQ